MADVPPVVPVPDALLDAVSPLARPAEDPPDDDVVPVENSLAFRAALKAAHVPVETHLFQNGGHGFGLRRVMNKPAEIWPDLFVNWARTHGMG